jgi:hypothetical protein
MGKSWAWWRTPISPITQEAEVGRIMVPGQPRHKKFTKTHLNRGKKLGVVGCTCHPNYNRKSKIGGM